MKAKVIYSLFLVTVLFLANLWLQEDVLPQEATNPALKQVSDEGSQESMIAQGNLADWVTPAIIAVGFIGVCSIFGKEESHEGHISRRNRFLQGEQTV
ncbi:MAG: hypothetical protein JXA82_03070 [Sedimentisphaerales bacterium]|nr:hypothetical protein [Sedimentisphaerales bacterium]